MELGESREITQLPITFCYTGTITSLGERGTPVAHRLFVRIGEWDF